MNISNTKLHLSLNNILMIDEHEMSSNDQLFLKRIYDEGLSKYEDRLNALGFNQFNNVLDAGCGFGQWSLALAGINRAVSSCDVSPLRIKFLKKLIKELGVKNINAHIGRLENLPFNDASFDAIFCYGAIFLTPWRLALAEFMRVLKPGGTLYVNANGLGWYILLWQKEKNKTIDYDPKAVAAKSFMDTLIYNRENTFTEGMNIIIEPKSLEDELIRLGFTGFTQAEEGGLHLDITRASPKSFFRDEYKNIPGVYEVVVRKLDN
jgi:SAM-dependent methyltransferase